MLTERKTPVKLREFGLNSYESRIWTALLSRGVSTAGELSDIANVPRSRSYDVLKSLEKKGFVVMKLGKPIKYIAVPPKEVLERVKKKLSEQTKTLIREIDSIKTGKLVKELVSMHEQGISLQSRNEIAGSLKGRKNLYNHLETMLRNAEKSVLLVTSSERFNEKAKHFKNIFDTLLGKGVKIKIAVKQDKENEKIENISKAIETTRTNINSRFCVIDNKEVLFMLFGGENIHPSYDIGIWVVDQNFAKSMKNLFHSI